MKEEFEDDDEEFAQGEGLEPTPANLAHWLEEQYHGDDRFESIEVLDPGPLEGEAVRVKFICNPLTYFFVAVLDEEGVIRVGLATESKAVNKAIEAAAEEIGESLTEFLEVSMDLEDELEHEVQHHHDDLYYFCSDIPCPRGEDLASDTLRDEIIFYLDGYVNSLYDFVEGEA
jgi:hypothetical protein